MERNADWENIDKVLQEQADRLRAEGDLVNRYISHDEVLGVIWGKQAIRLTHQFVETEERGLVRTHLKALAKCRKILKKSPDSGQYIKELDAVVTFLSDNQPARGRKSSKVAIGDHKKIKINKKQGYILIPDVARIFNVEHLDGEYVDTYCIVEYNSSQELVIRPYSLLDMSDDELDESLS
jgi:hypothetical protein